jgi:hypothetical protein
MMPFVRTTLTIEDALLTEIKQLAVRQGLPFKKVVDRTLRAGLGALKNPNAQARRSLHTFKMGRPRIALDKALALAAALEDSEIVRKLEAGK